MDGPAQQDRGDDSEQHPDHHGDPHRPHACLLVSAHPRWEYSGGRCAEGPPNCGMSAGAVSGTDRCPSPPAGEQVERTAARVPVRGSHPPGPVANPPWRSPGRGVTGSASADPAFLLAGPAFLVAGLGPAAAGARPRASARPRPAPANRGDQVLTFPGEVVRRGGRAGAGARRPQRPRPRGLDRREVDPPRPAAPGEPGGAAAADWPNTRRVDAGLCSPDSIGPLAADDRSGRTQEDGQVEAERPVLDIADVQLD